MQDELLRHIQLFLESVRYAGGNLDVALETVKSMRFDGRGVNLPDSAVHLIDAVTCVESINA